METCFDVESNNANNSPRQSIKSLPGVTLYSHRRIFRIINNSLNLDDIDIFKVVFMFVSFVCYCVRDGPHVSVNHFQVARNTIGMHFDRYFCLETTLSIQLMAD